MGVDKVLDSGVVGILKLGLSGLVFLLAYMSYGLMRAGTRSASPRSFQNAQRFMVFALVLAVLVAISSAIDVYLKKQEATSAHDVGRCRDALARVETAASIETTKLEELRATINNQLPACEPLFEKEGKDEGGAKQ